ASPAVPVGRDDPPAIRSEPRGLGGIVDRADRLGRMQECRIGGIHLDLGEYRCKRDFEWQEVAELLLDDVADHSLGLRAEYVERIWSDVRVRGCLKSQKPDLRAIAVGDHQLVVE